jgi:uncharacterized metal-binding protein
MTRSLPLLFACSGCSYAGRMAYELAQELDRRGIVEMSCLAGIGAGKTHFLNQLRDREVWIIDGCPIECSLGVFQQVRKRVDVHIHLHELGVRKKAQAPQSFDMEHLVRVALEQATVQRQITRRYDQTHDRPQRPASDVPQKSSADRKEKQ